MLIGKPRLIIFIVLFYLTPLYASQNVVNLTPQEQSWIQNHPHVSVGGGLDWAPFDFIDNNGEYTSEARSSGYKNGTSKSPFMLRNTRQL
jgi:hypothetical protein